MANSRTVVEDFFDVVVVMADYLRLQRLTRPYIYRHHLQQNLLSSFLPFMLTNGVLRICRPHVPVQCRYLSTGARHSLLSLTLAPRSMLSHCPVTTP